MPYFLTKILSLILSLLLIFEQPVFAQSLDLSHHFASLGKSTTIQSDKFRPLHLRYISYDSQNQDFKLLLDKGDFLKGAPEHQGTRAPAEKGLSPSGTVPDDRLQQETQELMKYFFIGLSLPNDKFWVNLRPDSPDNIIDDDLVKTDIGRIFLEADVQLKKDTASWTSPQNKEGKEYWDKLYKRAGELFGAENITIPTITRPWIVPNEIIIREAPDNAYIYKATLKVMLEEDYISKSQTPNPKSENRTSHIANLKSYEFSDPRLKELNEYSTKLIREPIIPKLTYQVNTSKRYAPLRQVYYSLILAQWFKQKYNQSTRAQERQAPEENDPYLKLIDSRNLTPTTDLSLITSHSYSNQDYFQQYQKSFQDGEYNLQETIHTPYGQSVRRYVSGGIKIVSSPFIISAADENIKKTAPYLLKISYQPGIVFGASSSVEQSGSPLPDYVPSKIQGMLRKNPDIVSFSKKLSEDGASKEDIESILLFFVNRHDFLRQGFEGFRYGTYQYLGMLSRKGLINGNNVKDVRIVFDQLDKEGNSHRMLKFLENFFIDEDLSPFLLRNIDFIAKNPVLITVLLENDFISLLNHRLESQDIRLNGETLEEYKKIE